jgi:hypothetical protein
MILLTNMTNEAYLLIRLHTHLDEYLISLSKYT